MQWPVSLWSGAKVLYSISELSYKLICFLSWASSFQVSARSSPHSPWSAGSSWNSRRSSWNSIGRAPSLKRRNQSGERKSLLSGDGKQSSEEGESSDEEQSSRSGSVNGSIPHRVESLETKGSFDFQDTLQVPSLYRTSSIHSSHISASEHPGCNGKTSSRVLIQQLHLEDPLPECDDMDDEGNLVSERQHTLVSWLNFYFRR